MTLSCSRNRKSSILIDSLMIQHLWQIAWKTFFHSALVSYVLLSIEEIQHIDVFATYGHGYQNSWHFGTRVDQKYFIFFEFSEKVVFQCNVSNVSVCTHYLSVAPYIFRNQQHRKSGFET